MYFHQASVFGDIEIVQVLIANGADINQKTWSDLTPVKIACIYGHFDVAKLLIDFGADQYDVMNGYQEHIYH